MKIKSLVSKGHVIINNFYYVVNYFEIDGEISIQTKYGLDYLKLGQFEVTKEPLICPNVIDGFCTQHNLQCGWPHCSGGSK